MDLVHKQLEALLQQENFLGAKALLVPVQPADIAEATGCLGTRSHRGNLHSRWGGSWRR